jgi:hypothetical protein
MVERRGAVIQAWADFASGAIVAAQRTGTGGVDMRLSRLLSDADSRLRARLASAQPSERAMLLGIN